MREFGEDRVLLHEAMVEQTDALRTAAGRLSMLKRDELRGLLLCAAQTIEALVTKELEGRRHGF